MYSPQYSTPIPQNTMTPNHFYKEDSYGLNNISVELRNSELWSKFHDLQTEMIITKSGRRMFPGLSFQIGNLDPNAKYCIFLEMHLESRCRFKYSLPGGWTPAGNEEAQSPHRIYMHPESPATGEHWMKENVNFSRLKLTNSTSPPQGHIVLSSMHRYQPRIIIIKSPTPSAFGWYPNKMFAFPETQFIAVTAYQNEDITKLKINHNPFAKGFRDNGKSNHKRKHNDKNNNNNNNDEVDLETKPSSSPKLKPQSPELRENIVQSLPLPPYYPPIYTPYQYYPIYYSTPAWTRYDYGTAQQEAHDLSRQNQEKPKKLTDFSIRAITGIS